ncbi:SDR family oxidoreductase [Paenibacillus taiwanensis]
MRRIGIPEDVARLITFIASDDSQWVSGQWIKSEGGYFGK